VFEARCADFVGKCPVAYSTMDFMAEFIRRQGFGRAELLELLRELPRPPAQNEELLSCG